MRVSMLLLAGCTLLLWGCGGGGVPLHTVKGQIKKDGNPLTITLPAKAPPGDPGAELGLVDLGNKTVIRADLNTKEGTFTVSGPTGKGVPAGKYKVYFRQGVYGSTDESKNPLSAEKSPLTIEVPGTGDLVIEVGKSPSAKWQ